MTKENMNTVGMAGVFDDPNALIHAAEKVRAAGYTHWDCHTPYPMHGLDDAMGLKPSPVPLIAIVMGFVGLAVAFTLTGGLSVLHYPIQIGGKPLLSWQAFVPIYFELFVLFAAFACLGCVVVLGKLGSWHSPLHDSGLMELITGDRYVIVLESKDETYSEESARTLLEGAGCKDIRPLNEFKEEEDTLI